MVDSWEDIAPGEEGYSDPWSDEYNWDEQSPSSLDWDEDDHWEGDRDEWIDDLDADIISLDEACNEWTGDEEWLDFLED